MRWFLSKDGETTGPFPESTIVEWQQEGRIQPSTYVQAEAGGEWMLFEVWIASRAKRTGIKPFPRILVGLLGAGVVSILFVCGVAGSRGKKDPAVASSAPSAPREISTFANLLGQVMRDPDAFDATPDLSGEKTTTWTFSTQNAKHAVFVRFKRNPDAWRFGLEGMRCEALELLGLSVQEISRSRGLGGRSQAWYLVKGGPLDGCYAKVFTDGAECMVLPGTQDYWRAQGERLPDPL